MHKGWDNQIINCYYLSLYTVLFTWRFWKTWLTSYLGYWFVIGWTSHWWSLIHFRFGVIYMSRVCKGFWYCLIVFFLPLPWKLKTKRRRRSHKTISETKLIINKITQTPPKLLRKHTALVNQSSFETTTTITSKSREPPTKKWCAQLCSTNNNIRIYTKDWKWK